MDFQNKSQARQQPVALQPDVFRRKGGDPSTHRLQQRSSSRGHRGQIADPGGSLRTAFKISAFVGQRDFTNTVNLRDRDFYRIQLPQRRRVQAIATNFSDNSLSVSILTQTGTGILAQDRVVKTGQRSQLRPMVLAAGVYYIQIEGSANLKSAYRLRLFLKSSPGGQDAPGGGDFDGGFTGDYDCADFSNQPQAQKYLLPGDPYNLDGDGDGIACETLPLI